MRKTGKWADECNVDDDVSADDSTAVGGVLVKGKTPSGRKRHPYLTVPDVAY